MSLRNATRLLEGAVTAAEARADAMEALLDVTQDRLTEAQLAASLDEDASFPDLERFLAEDRGWQLLTARADQQFSLDGLHQIASVARVMAVADPLLSRGLGLRVAYIWGDGASVTVRADDDVNAHVQAFLDHPGNRAAWSSPQAAQRLERTLGTDGNVFLACFTDQRTGAVEVRSIPFAEIAADPLCNPDDRAEPWLYLRRWSQPAADGTGPAQLMQAYHPGLDYAPPVKPHTVAGIPVRWDAPVLHVKVNDLDGWQFGIGDAYPALSWARAYKDFLTDWARLVRALSRYAWRVSGDKSAKAKQAAAALSAAADYNPSTGDGLSGAAFWSGPGVTLDAIPKTGATIDSESGRPLAAMVAASLGLPVTMLLADPGVTGARAVADTLDKPTEIDMGMRRGLWADVWRRLCMHAIGAAVRSPSGPLPGTVRRISATRTTVETAGDQPIIDIAFPDLEDDNVLQRVQAIAAADQTQKVPGEVIARLLLEALGVEDVDDILADMIDADGEFVDAGARAAQAAQRREDTGAGLVP